MFPKQDRARTILGKKRQYQKDRRRRNSPLYLQLRCQRQAGISFAKVELDQIVGTSTKSFTEDGYSVWATTSNASLIGRINTNLTYKTEKITEHVPPTALPEDITGNLSGDNSVLSLSVTDSINIGQNILVLPGILTENARFYGEDETSLSIYPRLYAQYRPDHRWLFSLSGGFGGRGAPSAEELLEGYDMGVVVNVPKS
jgi:hypothetical protein